MQKTKETKQVYKEHLDVANKFNNSAQGIGNNWDINISKRPSHNLKKQYIWLHFSFLSSLQQPLYSVPKVAVVKHGCIPQ